MTRPEFSADQNEVVVGSGRYIAVESDPGRCTGRVRCVFAVGFGCELLQAMGPYGGESMCQGGPRTDGRSIVWVLKATHKGVSK